MHINDNIKKYRKLSKLSQQELADKIGVKRSTYAEWENGIIPKGDILSKIAAALNVGISDILEVQNVPKEGQPDLMVILDRISTTNQQLAEEIIEQRKIDRQRASLPTPADLIRCFAAYGVGKKLWDSQTQAQDELHNILFLNDPKVEQGGS